MAQYSTFWYILALGLCSLITKTQLTAHDSSHGYISSNEKYFDDFSFMGRDISSGIHRSEYVGDNVKFQIKFDPATLDFRQRPLGVPHIKRVHLYNFDTNRSIDMTSISGSTVHFHSSFFHDKKIPPMGNTSFNVVFLGREEGYIESCLFIHTNNGHFKYNVKGVSIYSPYYLRPIVNVKLPVNATFSPLIYLHNPHSTTIQIMEVYTSGGDFHMELPTGEREGPKNIWEIAPYETKAVIRVKFCAKLEQNHTAYVRIRLNITEEVLVVPLEVQAGPMGGIFSPQGYVDFGIGGSMEPPKQVKLCLYNPFMKPVKIQSITTKSKSIKIDYQHPVLLPTGRAVNGCADIANLTLNWREAFKNQDFNGKIMVKYRNGKSNVEIPFFVTVLEGGLSYDPQVTKYFANDKTKRSARQFKLKNDFKTTIRILNLTLGEEVQKYFKIENFKSKNLREQEQINIFSVDVKPGIKLENLEVNSFIKITTNVSNVVVPVLSYKGTLELFLPFKSKDYSLDVGLISFNTKKEINFLVLNNNPVNVQMKSLKTSIPLTSTKIIGCGRGNPKMALLHFPFSKLQSCNHLKPGEYAILKLVVQTANNEGHVWGEIQIETDYENLSIPVQFRVAAGKLEIGPDRLVFDQCFPGKICSHPLRVHSTFNEPMIIKNIITIPPDPRLSSKHSGHILAHTAKVVGHLYLNPNIGCKNECYTGLHPDVYDQWLKTLMLPTSVVNFDLNLFNTFYNRFLNITSNGMKKWQNLTLRLDTSEVRSHMFKTRVKMSWPSLLSDDTENKSVIMFPLTQIGNISFKNITIKNPSSNNLIIQILFDVSYPGVELLYEGLPAASLPEFFASSGRNNFFFVENNQVSRHSFFDKVHFSSIPTFLKPGENYTFLVGFHGDKIGDYSSLLFFRNNLTVLEVLRLQGRITEPAFRFGNRKPGASQPLLFEFTDKYVKECEKESHFRFQNHIAVKRSFTARNIGDIPIFVNNFYINDAPCEGYGFKILNCAPFILPANGTKKIDIEFSPDFTLAKIIRSLKFETSCNFDVNYTLQATIPSYYINICSNVIPRPFWEWYLGFVSLTLICVSLFFILFVAIFDAEKIKRQMIDPMIIVTPQFQEIFDLKQVGQQVREEVQNVKSEDVKFPTKNLQIENEIYKLKPEIEKVPALIPTVGKSKRKLGKRHSNDDGEYVETSKKIEAKTNNFTEKRDYEEKKTSHYNKENKKVINCKKNHKFIVEEDTNTDEILEKNSKKINKEQLKIAQNKIEKKKLTKKDFPDNIKVQINVNKNENKKNLIKDRKEKSTTCRKFSAEKAPIKSSDQGVSTRVWTENRATFSDVVARSDNRKPTVYVEPYKQNNAPLGPIGSKPVDYWQNVDSSNQHSSQLHHTDCVNSYFSSDTENIRLGDVDQCTSWNNIQETEQMLQYDMLRTTSLAAPAQDYANLDSWTPNLLSPDSFWDSNCSSSLGHTLNNTNDLGSSTPPLLPNRPSSYLWESSPIWRPFPLDLPRTPTRTPPGFSSLHQNNIEEEEAAQSRRSEMYNPFTSNNIWNQQQNIWKYSKDS